MKAVVKWIGKHYDLKTHPGQGEAGLFYYYHTFAKALAALGEDTIADDKGVEARLAEGPGRRSWPAARRTTARGSTPTPSGWKGTPTSAPALPCWPWLMRPRKRPSSRLSPR